MYAIHKIRIIFFKGFFFYFFLFFLRSMSHSLWVGQAPPTTNHLLLAHPCSKKAPIIKILNHDFVFDYFCFKKLCRLLITMSFSLNFTFCDLHQHSLVKYIYIYTQF